MGLQSPKELMGIIPMTDGDFPNGRIIGWYIFTPLIDTRQADPVTSGHRWSFHCKLGLLRLLSKLAKQALPVISALGWHVSSLVQLGVMDLLILHSDGHCCGQCS